MSAQSAGKKGEYKMPWVCDNHVLDHKEFEGTMNSMGEFLEGPWCTDCGLQATWMEEQDFISFKIFLTRRREQEEQEQKPKARIDIERRYRLQAEELAFSYYNISLYKLPKEIQQKIFARAAYQVHKDILENLHEIRERILGKGGER